MKAVLENRQRATRLDLRRLRTILRRIAEQIPWGDRELSIVFLDDAGIRVLNRQYLCRDRPTNVLAFAMNEGEWGGVNPHILGDLAISVETALAQAVRADMPVEDVLAFYMIHGILHLTGYDHEGVSREEVRRMEEKEDEVFFRLTGYRLDRG